MTERKCPNCGKTIPASEKRCPACKVCLSTANGNLTDNLPPLDEEITATDISGFGIGRGVAPFVFAVLFTFLFQNYLAPLFEADSFMRSLFRPPGDWMQLAIPSAILFLFFWAMVDLLFKFINIRMLQRHLKSNLLLGCPRCIRANQLDSLLEEVHQAKEKAGEGLVYDTVYELLANLKSTNDPQRCHEFLRHQSDLNSEAMRSGYTREQVFIWAMPILGFIGTVIGISLAVGDFSGFLTGEIEDVDRVKTELSKVATGLSFAFNTTLLGLVTSLFAMLFSSFVQRNGEWLLECVEELCLRVIASFPVKTEEPVEKTPDAVILEAMGRFAESVAGESHRAREYLEEFTSRFERSGAEIAQGYAGLQASLDAQTAEFGSRMANITGDITTSLESASQALRESTQGLTENLTSLPQDMHATREALTSALEQVKQSSDQLENAFTETASGFIESSQQLAQRVDGLVPAQELIREVSRSLNDTNSLLREMQRSQEETSAVLAQLRGPLEFKLVPAGDNPDKGV